MELGKFKNFFKQNSLNIIKNDIVIPLDGRLVISTINIDMFILLNSQCKARKICKSDKDILKIQYRCNEI